MDRNCLSLRTLSRSVKQGALFFFLLLLLAGCGYRFSGSGGVSVAHLKTFFIDVFTNKTAETYAGNTFRNAFISQFVQAGRFKMAHSREEADLVCRGTIKSVVTSPLSYTPTNLAMEERITASIEVVCEDQKNGRIVWSDRNFTQTGDYRFANTASVEKNREDALLKLADDMAERAYSLMMSDF